MCAAKGVLRKRQAVKSGSGPSGYRASAGARVQGKS